MRKFWKFCLLLFVLLGLAILYFSLAIRIDTPEIADRSIEQVQRQTLAPNFYKINNNWLRKSETGLWELYLEGDGFERGIVNGKLTKELAEAQELAFVGQIKQMIPSPKYLQFLKYFVAYFNRKLPEHINKEYLEEIYGVSLSASDAFDEIAPKYYRILNYHSAHDIGHALQDKNMAVGCTSFCVWKNKSADGQLLLGRNFDFFVGDAFAENKIVCFTKPKNGNKFMYVTWAGFTGVVSGMNDKGLTLTINAAKSDVPNSAATPIAILCKEILQYASNIQEAMLIAEKRKTFVSESILIGSVADGKSVIIEKTPVKTNLYDENGDQIICPNHFQSALFKNDYLNNKNIIQSSSYYRKVRMEQLLKRHPQMDPTEAAEILRDQNGINDRQIGLGNEKGINQLIAHHAVIFQPQQGRMWVSCSPFQLGKFVCYDLNKVFSQATQITPGNELTDRALDIAADPFLYSAHYQNFILFKELRKKIEYVIHSPYNLIVSEKALSTFATSNPNSYLTYWVLADYYKKVGDTKMATLNYKRALTCEVATLTETEKIQSQLKLIQDAH